MLDVIWKMLALNVGIVAFDVALFSRGFLGLQFSTGSLFSRFFAIFMALVSLTLAILGNWKLLFSKKERQKNTGIGKTTIMISEEAQLRHYTSALSKFIKRKTSVRDVVNNAISQVDSFYEKSENLTKITTRNEVDHSILHEGMQDAEQAISSNLRTILNLLDIYDEESGKSHECRNLIAEALRANESILTRVDELLIAASKMKGMGNLVESPKGLESTLTAIKTANQQYQRKQ